MDDAAREGFEESLAKARKMGIVPDGRVLLGEISETLGETTRLIASWTGVAVVQSSGHQALRHARCWFWLSPHAEKDHPTLLVHFRLLSPVG